MFPLHLRGQVEYVSELRYIYEDNSGTLSCSYGLDTRSPRWKKNRCVCM